MSFLKNIILGFSVSFLAAACANFPEIHPAEKIATQANLQPKLITAGEFTLTTFSRLNNPTLPLHVYIEGDGAAWRTRFEASPNPTPKRALALQLAARDSHANVLYIARPCQFTDLTIKTCDQAYWTHKRFSPEVIASTNSAINQFIAQFKQARIILIGYSGGAAVAALAAIQRKDVIGLVTVAGNLDTEALNRHHQVSAMPQSLNPANYSAQIARIPQLHWVGEKDTRVPPQITEQFVARQTAPSATIIRVPNTSHEAGWLEKWPKLLTMLNAFTQSF